MDPLAHPKSKTRHRLSCSKTKRPIVGIYANISNYISLNSWDRFQIPMPFSSIKLKTTEEIYIEENADLEEYTKLLEEKMIGLELKENT